MHIAEIDSFLRAHDRYGAKPLDAAGRDEYVAQSAVVARALGATDLPETAAELDEVMAGYRPELESTAAARQAARFILVHPPVPIALRLPYSMLSAAAVGADAPVDRAWPFGSPTSRSPRPPPSGRAASSSPRPSAGRCVPRPATDAS